MLQVKCDAAGKVVWIRKSRITAVTNHNPDLAIFRSGLDVALDAIGNMYITEPPATQGQAVRRLLSERVPLKARTLTFLLLSTTRPGSAEGNQWLLNGNPAAGATSESYWVEETGYYTVRVTINGCSNTSEASMITSIENKQAAKGSLSVYPNPAREQLLLSYSPTYQTIGARITLFTATGAKIAEYPLGQAGNNTWQVTVPVQQLRKGMYYLVIRDGKSQRSAPFVKE